jgi:shikimate kinase
VGVTGLLGFAHGWFVALKDRGGRAIANGRHRCGILGRVAFGRTPPSTPDAHFFDVTPIAHLVGPGGAGKTSAGAVLAQRLGWQFVDLDERFISLEGSIGVSIESSGYSGYAKRNVAVYGAIKRSLVVPTVLALSSGFLTYPEDMGAEYQALRRAIERDTLTVLLMPAFELEACVEIIVERQLSRPYLPGNRASEERRIRERFSKLMALPCVRFQSDASPEETALQIERFVRARIAHPEQTQSRGQRRTVGNLHGRR